MGGGDGLQENVLGHGDSKVCTSPLWEGAGTAPVTMTRLESEGHRRTYHLFFMLSVLQGKLLYV